MSIRTGSYKIQVKRTNRTIDDPIIQAASLEFGEPFYMNQQDYFVVGPKPTENPSDNLIPNLKVVKVVNRVAVDVDDDLDTVISVADKGVFYKNKSGNVATLMDEDTNSINPRTTTTAITDGDGTTLAALLVDKVDIDTASLKRSTLGYDSNGVFVSEETVNTSGIPDEILDIINNKVSIDSESDPDYSPLSLGEDLIGVFVRINDEHVSDSNFIKSYIDNQLNISLADITDQITVLQQLINATSGLYVNNTPPAVLNQLWLDTTPVSGGLKYYDTAAEIWKHVAVAYT